MASRRKLRKAKKHGFQDGKRWKQRGCVLSASDYRETGHKRRERSLKDKKSAEWHAERRRSRFLELAGFKPCVWSKNNDPRQTTRNRI